MKILSGGRGHLLGLSKHAPNPKNTNSAPKPLNPNHPQADRIRINRTGEGNVPPSARSAPFPGPGRGFRVSGLGLRVSGLGFSRVWIIVFG